MYSGVQANFLALNKLRGFTLRQQRLLELEAVFLGTQYAGLPPWEQEIGPKVDPVTGATVIAQLCGHEREPRIKAGVIEEKVGKLLRLLVGEGRFPTLNVSGSGAEKLLAALKRDVKLAQACRGPARDLIVKGSGPLGFALLSDGRPEALQLRPEWCEPVFVAKVGRPRAAELADELDALGVRRETPRSDREYLWTPDGAASMDLAFLRYEYVYHEEAAESDGAAGEVCWRHRVDYLPSSTVYYRDVKVHDHDTDGVEWEVDYIDDHGWGVVPIAWGRALDAEDGEAEGPSFITQSLRSISEAADRMLTRKDASVGVISSPKAYTIDLRDAVADYNADTGAPTGWRASSSEVLSFESKSGSPAAKIGLLEPTGKGPEVAKAHLDDLLAHAQRVSGVIAHDPQAASSVQSGVALERMMEPTIALVNDFRVAMGELLASFCTKLAVALKLKVDDVEVQWPPVIAQTAADQAAVADALTKATGGSAVLSQETATRIAAHAFEVEDPDGEVQRVQASAEQAMQVAREALSARTADPAQQPPQDVQVP